MKVKYDKQVDILLPEFGVKIFHSLFCKGLETVDNSCSP